MPSDQHVEMAWETPTHDQITAISKQHVAGMEATDHDAAWIVAGMHHVLLRTVGRRSGTVHQVALPFWRDAAGHPIVVASFAGHERHPAWYLNLADRTANPRVNVRVQHGEYWSEPEILEGDDYAQTWDALTDDRAWYRGYQERTARRIPLVRLAPVTPEG